MYLKRDPANKVQTTFGGTRCAFEVKRSIEEDIDAYSSRLEDCVPNDDYNVIPTFEVAIGRVEDKLRIGDTNKSEFTNYSFQWSNVTFN
jgi:hypothetical protein